MPTLNWIGKAAVVKHHRDVPYRLLEPVPELSLPSPSGRGGSSRSDERAAKDGGPGLSGEAGLRSLKGGEGAVAEQDFGGNLIVQGDNLLALKALLPRYAGQVKCIYIDPPYNTGNEGWVYNDNVNSPEIRKWLGEVVGREGETLDRHDRWLCMMYPRLMLLKQFLREDGAIFVSIDDNEVAALRMMMDEIFGSSNFVADMVWAAGRKNDSKLVSVSHEYIVCYARNKVILAERKIIWRQSKKGLNEIYAQYQRLKHQHGEDYLAMTTELKRWYKELPDSHPSKAHKHYSQVDRRGIYFAADISWPGGGGPQYDVVHPKTKKPVKNPARGWSTPDPGKMQAWIADDRVHFGPDETSVPCLKSYLKDKELQTPYSVFYQDGRAATKRLRELMSGNMFEFPKDEEVLQEVFSMLTRGDDLILDSFAGSGTTGHAVLKQNAEDGGKRRFILVEMDENIARNVTAERVKRVAQGYVRPSTGSGREGEKVDGLGGGFQFCTLSKEPLFTAEGQIRSDVTFAQLAEFVWFKETGVGLPPHPPVLPPGERGFKSPLIGVHGGRAIYLLYNGILKDKSVNGGNVLTGKVLTGKVLELLPSFDGPKVIYAAACRMSEPRLRREGIVFKQTPYALAV